MPEAVRANSLGKSLPACLLAVPLFMALSTAAMPRPAMAEGVLSIAVNSERPGYFNLVSRLAKAFNKRAGQGEMAARNLVSIIPVEDDSIGLDAVKSGRADLAVSSPDTIRNSIVELTDYKFRPLSVEMLTIITRRISLIRDPRQLRGLKVEIAGDRTEEIIGHMNTVLKGSGISIDSGTYMAAPDTPDDDPYLRLCRSEYDVRVDMVVHPYPPFSGTLPCDVRVMSFANLAPPEGEHPSVMRYVVKSGTYDWQSGDLISLGSPVVLLGKGDTLDANPVYEEWLSFLNVEAEQDAGILDSFDAENWSKVTLDTQ
jgi:hypothetical protein